MKIAISYEGRHDPIGIEISDEMTLADLSAYIEAEVGVVREDQLMYHNSAILENFDSTLAELGVTDGDIIMLTSKGLNTLNQSNTDPMNRIEMYRQQILADPNLNSQLRDTNPSLHSKLSDSNAFRDSMIEMLQAQNPSLNVQNEEIRRLQQNPEDPENQQKILEMIRQQQIEENLQLAYDISPESFVSVNMLYIKLLIKGHTAYALVDSGAQQTIIHPKLAEDFGISNLLDKRFSSMTLGVGATKSEGRIHSVPVSLGDTNLEVPCSFTVVETHVGILFGLDMLRRHKCCIDLSKDALIIGNREVKFLTEAEIAKNVKTLTTATLESLKNAQDSTSDMSPIQASSNPNIRPPADTRPPANTRPADAHASEGAIEELISLGFTRAEAIAALKATNGNMELAASLLFQ